jgi:hypothetical protein
LYAKINIKNVESEKYNKMSKRNLIIGAAVASGVVITLIIFGGILAYTIRIWARSFPGLSGNSS